ncbi:MAG TPA: tetratricopeptide repeat protein [Polyangia bacterium]|nr:tetratricopeptide repeat protein [Polyangia bacterium]
MLDTSPPRPPAEARRAPTLIGTAASLAEKPSLAPVDKPPPPPVEKSSPRLADKPSPPPVEKRSPPPALKPSPPAPVPPAVVHPVAVEPQRAALAMTAVEPPRAALAMTAVIPSTGSTLALAAPSLGFLPRSRRNLAVAAGAATLTVAVAILLTHRSPADPQGSVAADLSAVPKPPGVSAPLAVLHETPRPPTTLEPLAAPAAHGAKGAAADDAAKAAPQAHERVRTTPPAAAHQRRYAKQEKRGKHARHDKRNARRTEVASRAAASPGNDSEARASYERGNTLLFSGDAAGAVTAYQKAVALAPADPIGYRGLGLAHEQRGETGAAIRALRKYLKLAPGAADREIISRRIARLGRAASQP